MKQIRNMRFMVGFVAFALLAAFSYAPIAEGVPAMPGEFTHVQSDGVVVQYQVHGDEFLSYMTDSNGNLVAFGQDGDIYLARWAEEHEADSPATIPTIVKPAGTVPGTRLVNPETPLAEISIPQHHIERAEQALAERDAQWKEQSSVAPATGFSAIQTAEEDVLERKVLIIYVYFEEDGGVPSIQRLTLPKIEELYNLMYDENTFGTVAHYYKTVTNGTAKVVPAETNSEKPGIILVQLPGSHRNWGRASDNDPRNNLVTPALRMTADPTNPGGYIDYSQFDDDGNGTIISSELSIGFVVHGYESSSGGVNANFPSIWGHAWSLAAPGLELNGVRLRNYFAQGSFHNRTVLNPPILTMGILAHELGHSCFGFTDLYDTGGGSGHRGVGYFTLMASGSWGGTPSGSIPTGVDAYHLFGGNGNTQLVAPKPLAATGANNALANPYEYAMLGTTDTRQYFLLQPFGDVGYNRGFLTNNALWSATAPNISGGLLAWIVDNNLTSSNNLTSRRHYRVAVLEASWTRSTDVYNLSISRGNTAMLFSGATKTFLDDDSTPSTKIYETTTSVYPTVPSGWNINSISSYVTGAGTRDGVVHANFTTGALPAAPPVITMQPQNTYALLGATARFTVGANGTQPMVYQWQRSTNGVTWNDIAGANSAVYSFATSADHYSEQIRALLSNDFGTATSNIALLILGTLPTVTGHPLNQSVNPGEEATFSVTATDLAPLLYQWQRSNNNGSSWSNVSGATFPTYSITTQASDNNAQFRATVTNMHGQTQSNHAVLTVAAGANNMMGVTTLPPFGFVQTPYTQPAAYTLTLTNTGPGSITLTQPTAVNYDIGTLSTTTLAANGDTATFTVRPKASLAIGSYYETISISGSNGAFASVLASFTVVADPIYIVGVTLDRNVASVHLGNTLKLNASFQPTNATDRRVVWNSDNLWVATVNENGLVTPMMPGTTIITVKTVDGGFEATCHVTVTTPVSRVTITPSAVSVDVGDQYLLMANVEPFNVSNATLVWSSDNAAVATVTQGGFVTAVGYGTATITATAADGTGIFDTCIVNVPFYFTTGVTLNKTFTSIHNGSSETLVATVLPANASDKRVTWNSDNHWVATVDTNGLVTAVGPGSANITATTMDGRFSATCYVSVTTPATSVTINPSSITISSGDMYILEAVVAPFNVSNSNVTWSSSNEAAATVTQGGLVRGVGGGTSTITATAADGTGVSGTSTVTVTP